MGRWKKPLRITNVAPERHHNDALRKPKAVEGLPPDLSRGETLTPWECEQKVKQARNAVLDEIERAMRPYVDHTDLESGMACHAAVHRIIEDMRRE
jgi:hypothetical protein